MKRIAAFLFAFFNRLMFAVESLILALIVGACFWLKNLQQILWLEAGTLGLFTLLFLLTARWAARRSLAVGTVRRGSPQEKDADKVLRIFSLAEWLLEMLLYAMLGFFIMSFFMFEGRFGFWLHNGLLAALGIGLYCAERWLGRVRKQRGYGEYGL